MSWQICSELNCTDAYYERLKDPTWDPFSVVQAPGCFAQIWFRRPLSKAIQEGIKNERSTQDSVDTGGAKRNPLSGERLDSVPALTSKVYERAAKRLMAREVCRRVAAWFPTFSDETLRELIEARKEIDSAEFRGDAEVVLLAREVISCGDGVASEKASIDPCLSPEQDGAACPGGLGSSEVAALPAATTQTVTKPGRYCQYCQVEWSYKQFSCPNCNTGTLTGPMPRTHHEAAATESEAPEGMLEAFYTFLEETRQQYKSNLNPFHMFKAGAEWQAKQVAPADSELRKALEMATVQFQALKINNRCIGLDKVHVDFNCTHCLASHGERCASRALDAAPTRPDYEAEANILWTTLGRISAMCGTPDAAEGCRNILKLIQDIHKELQVRISEESSDDRSKDG